MILATLSDDVECELDGEFQLDHMKVILDELSYPVDLIARKSNWQGHDGYYTAHHVDEIISSITSFGSSDITLVQNDDKSLHFELATHDVPTGFFIEIKESKCYIA